MAENRYIRASDPKVEEVAGFAIPSDWWSRGYEYAWALSRVKGNQTVMDAGCGLVHPLKWALAERSRKVYAVDLDSALALQAKRERIEYVVADLADTGLPSESVHTIYCISVIEHLYQLDYMPKLWSEFARLLKPNGRVFITFDVPDNGAPRFSKLAAPEDLVRTVPPALSVDGEIDFAKPDDAIHHETWGLNVFRLALRKVS